MQYKKDEIKSKIDGAALSIFAKKGYVGATVSDIGKEAGVSIGNIYKYYGSKEEIFYANIGEAFIEKAKALLSEKICAAQRRYSGNAEGEGAPWLADKEVASFMADNRSRLLIVFGKSIGTKYENTKKELVEFIIGEVEKQVFNGVGGFSAGSHEGYTARIIYNGMIDMVLNVLEDMKDEEELRRSFNSLNTYHLFGITRFLEESTRQLTM